MATTAGDAHIATVPSGPSGKGNSADPAAAWVVQKFGGTSVGKFLDNIVDQVVPQYLPTSNLVLVCSARSGSTKSTGTTNLLLRAASEALAPAPSSRPGSVPPTPGGPLSLSSRSRSSFYSPGPSRSASPGPGMSSSVDSLRKLSLSRDEPEFAATVDLLKAEHMKAVEEAVKNEEIRKEVEEDIERDIEGLREFLHAAQIIDEISPRSKDAIVGLGERLACRIVVATLKDRGVPAELVSLEGIIDAFVEGDLAGNEVNSLDQGFYDRLAKRLGERLRECEDRVPVVTGFFGPVPGSLLRNVGRGYTDLCAALCAVGLAASELQVWKEVDGIFTADPRKVATARLIPIITPDEAAELTYYGSEVIHPFTMEQVIRAAIPIRIKNVMNPLGSGTVIYPDAPTPTPSTAPGTPAAEQQNAFAAGLTNTNTPTVVQLAANGYHGPSRARKLPTAVTVKDGILVLNVHSNRKTISHGFLARIFGTLDRYGVVVDLISTSEVHVSMAIHDSIGKRVIDRLLGELRLIGTVDVHRGMAIVSLVGKAMKHTVGIAGKMFTVLASGNVNIEMISQGASEINISCVVEERDAVKAMNIIHQACLNIAPSQGLSSGPWLF